MTDLTDYSCPDCAHRGPHYPAGVADADDRPLYICNECGTEFAPRTVEVHADSERCFLCASDAELQAAASGRPHPTIYMDRPDSFCPWSLLLSVVRPAPPEVTS